MTKLRTDTRPPPPLERVNTPPSAARTDARPPSSDPERPRPDAFIQTQRPETAPLALLTPAAADAFMAEVVDRERPFYAPGAGYDAATGMTFDGETLDFATGAVTGKHPFSAASKESLHIGLLVKALEGDAFAQRLLTPAPKHPEAAVARALEVLTAKISTCERFNREYPGFGGFLPWYVVQDGAIAPAQGWEKRVPSLDNGEWAWALYAAAHLLKDTGHPALAARYEAQLKLMGKNAVRIFYDAAAKQLRSDARIKDVHLPPAKNEYTKDPKDTYLDDGCEGLLMCHFADLFGHWRGHREGREAIWAKPRQHPAEYITQAGRTLTTARGNWFSSHEEWGYALLPYRDVPLADTLFRNAQKVRTWYSADRAIPGLFASTTKPLHSAAEPSDYVSAVGVRPVAQVPVVSERIAAPYAAFPLALVDKPMFATWLKTMLEAPRMWGPNGIGESFDVDGTAFAPVLTWDGKALEMLAWTGGLADETRWYLKRDGKYEALMSRVTADYREFAGKPVQGTDVPLAAPTARVPRGMPDFLGR
jgi:hypothetical protein